ncbi:hypothetical protein DEO72_LG7g833 [Vigna unguiculata]|uniref:Uncharacterized protein n=1 Tax=Vigna unguiculata TaxID=3917 RepID=A0A4D6MFM1_VIGUN|nr:hypothetical protein DEO72_LG7g833 [Vigna unguiculata]
MRSFINNNTSLFVSTLPLTPMLNALAHAHIDAQSSRSRMWSSSSSTVLSRKGRRILAIRRGWSWGIQIQ